ncbi:MAG: hypothetical protein J3K34DRAFT_406411 [Monoraphidium minutum]|nr:MAG: hypothetical protein J3K34DRAFT_406411 [Monoraphidium minutum]
MGSGRRRGAAAAPAPQEPWGALSLPRARARARQRAAQGPAFPKDPGLFRGREAVPPCARDTGAGIRPAPSKEIAPTPQACEDVQWAGAVAVAAGRGRGASSRRGRRACGARGRCAATPEGWAGRAARQRARAEHAWPLSTGQARGRRNRNSPVLDVRCFCVEGPAATQG